MQISLSSLRSPAIRRALICALALILAAHAFCFLNPTYSGASTMIHAASGRSGQIAEGRFLQPIYWRLRGGVSAPLIVGILSTAYLSLTAAAAVFLLRLECLGSIFALCGAMTVNAAVTSVFAASLHTADAFFLSLLLAAVSAVLCCRMCFGVLPAMALLAAGLGLGAEAAGFFAALALLALISDLLAGESPRACLKKGLIMLLALAGGMLIAQAGAMLMQMRAGQRMHGIITLPKGDLIGAWLAPIRALFAPLTAYASLNVLLHILLFVLVFVMLIRSARQLARSSMLLLVLILLLLPLSCSLNACLSGGAAQTTPAYYLLDACAILLLFRLPDSRTLAKKAAVLACSVLFMGSIVFSNQVYLKKNLEFESTLSFMTRIVDRIEETPGFRPGYTPVAILGTPQDSALIQEKKGFEHLTALDAAADYSAITNNNDMIWYCWEVLGYPFDFVSAYDLEQLRSDPQVQAMPAYPQEGCCAFIGDTLVIRLSESI